MFCGVNFVSSSLLFIVDLVVVSILFCWLMVIVFMLFCIFVGDGVGSMVCLFLLNDILIV